MKKNKLTYQIIIIIIFICTVFLIIKSQSIKDQSNVSNELFGYWKGDNEENPGFEITKDYFIIGDKKLNYKINGNNITVDYSKFIFNGKYRIEKNTLFIESDGNTDVFYRWCEDINDICKE